MNMDIEAIKQNVVEAYHEAVEQNLSPFALMDEDDAYYITIRYSGHIMALNDLVSQGYLWAAQDYQKLMSIMESPIRRFLVAIELKMDEEGIDYKHLFMDQEGIVHK